MCTPWKVTQIKKEDKKASLSFSLHIGYAIYMYVANEGIFILGGGGCWWVWLVEVNVVVLVEVPMEEKLDKGIVETT